MFSSICQRFTNYYKEGLFMTDSQVSEENDVQKRRDAELDRMLSANPRYESSVMEHYVSGSPMNLWKAPANDIDDVEEVEVTEDHDHVWKRGLLPGGKYTKSCKVCFVREPIDFAEWQRISDR